MPNIDQKDDDLIKESVSELVREILCQEVGAGKIAILLSVFSKFVGASRVAEQQAQELSWDNIAMMYIEVYEGVLDEFAHNRK